MVTTAKEIRTISTDEVRNVSVDMSGFLDGSEVLTGAPTVQSSGNITVTGSQLNASSVVIDGQTIGASKAVQFVVSSSVPGTHIIEIRATTDASQTVEARVKLIVERTKY